MEDCCSAVDDGEVVSAGGQAAPLFGVAESALDHVAVLVVDGVEAGWPPAGAAPVVTVAPLIVGFRMTAVIPRRRRWVRIARDEWALTPRTASGLVRALPPPIRSTRRWPISVSNMGESSDCPGVSSTTGGPTSTLVPTSL